MEVRVRVKYLKKIADWNKIPDLEDELKWSPDDKWIAIDLYKWPEKAIEALYKIGLALKTDPAADRDSRIIRTRIQAFRALKEKADGVLAKTLPDLAMALKELIRPTPHRWLFHDEGEYILPYFVDEIKYHPARRTRDETYPAYVEVGLAARKNNSNIGTHINFHIDDLKVLPEIMLRKRGWFMETKDLYSKVEADMAAYMKYQPMTGEQFLAAGTGVTKGEERWSSRIDMPMERDGQKAKVVMDDAFVNNESGRGSDMVSLELWEPKIEDDSENEDGEVGYPMAKLPIHPYVSVFDLSEHCHVELHISGLEPYIYNKGLMDKLVLPPHKKDVISLLIQGASETGADIIAGKTKGIIVLATGEPGTGKTLTAEVFSESVERPLYVVQCSQLGTDEVEIEKQLKEVLQRATRWKAILLIDEADVYIRERGEDIRQNAIVGVFLRVLEYYRGVLFMTSNRATVIDDAIMSRATAWIRYTIPTQEELQSIWGILSGQYKADMNQAMVKKAAATFPSISGRAVKNLVRLATMLAGRRKAKVDIALLRYVAQFQGIDLEDEKK
jgi:hypothetical protein